MSVGVIVVRGFGAGGETQLAADLVAFGLPAEADRTQRRLDASSVAEGFYTLVSDIETWRNIAAVGGALGTIRAAVGGVDAMRRRLAASSKRGGVALIKVVVPAVPTSWGTYTSISLAEDQFVDAVAAWHSRFDAVERALMTMREEGQAAFGDSAECVVYQRGIRLRWASPKGFTKHECDFDDQGQKLGAIREGWSDAGEFRT